MIVTEKQAGEHFCHQAIPKGDGGPVSKCSASKCMAWRWGESEPKPQFWRCTDRYATTEPETFPPNVPCSAKFSPYDPSDARSVAGWELVPDTDRHGYCGLAGIPQFPLYP